MTGVEEDSLVGTLFAGRFRVESLLGSGGMGAVYKAQHEVLQRPFALKVIRKELLADLSIAARFRREARAASRIDHENIIQIFDFGQATDGRLYLAMEYVEGPTLGDLLKREGLFSVPRVLWVLDQIAGALDAAHASNVIHRDLKPSNIVVTAAGEGHQLKILDFGLAKIVDLQATAGLSVHGKVFGTPEYISPERCMDQPADHRTDIYSLGIILFELLVGRPPFRGGVVQTLGAHINQPPPWPSEASKRDDIPQRLDELVLRCLAKKPEDRFQSGRELVGVARSIRARLSSTAGPRPIDRPPIHTDGEASSGSSMITLPPEDLVEMPDATVAETKDTISIDGPPSLVPAVEEDHGLLALEVLAYALRDRGLGTAEVTYQLALLIEAKDALVHATSSIQTLQQGAGELQMTARLRVSRLTQIQNQLQHELALIGSDDERSAVAQMLSKRREVIDQQIKNIGEQTAFEHRTLEEQIEIHRLTLPELQEDLEQRAKSLRALLQRMAPHLSQSQGEDQELKDLFEAAGC